jgi:cytochrome c oxidase subunit 3
LEDGKFYFPDDNFRDEPLNDKILDKSNTASSFIYVLSGLHLAHLAGGFLYLIFLLFRSQFRGFGPTNNLSLKQGASYWHFLDILWLYLFLFLLFIH